MTDETTQYYLVRFTVDGHKADEIFCANSVDEAEYLFCKLHPNYQLDSVERIDL